MAAFGSVALYTAYYMGEAKLEASALYIVVGALAAVWAVVFGALLLTMERKYVRTFFLTMTGGEFSMNIFLDNVGNDELRADIFTNNQELWRPIRPEVEAWLRLRFKIWKRDKPAWFTEALRRSIPADMLTLCNARGSSIHNASVAQRPSLSLGVYMPASLTRVAAEAEAESSDSDSETSVSESAVEAQPAHIAGMKGESAVHSVGSGATLRVG